MNRYIRLLLSTIQVALVSLFLISAVSPELLGEPWNTLLFGIGFPILIQGYKIWKDKGGKTPSKLFLQVTSFVVSGIFVYANGGFAGYALPAFPVWGDDLVAFLDGAIVFAREFTVVVGLAFGAMMALYEGVLKRLFEMVGFAAEAKVASRKVVGFLA